MSNLDTKALEAAPSLEAVVRDILENHRQHLPPWIASALDGGLSVASPRSTILEEAARVADLCHADIVANPHDFGPTDSGGVVACKKIAAAIRSLSKETVSHG